MKIIHIISGVLLFLLIAVSSASAASYPITVSNTGQPIDISVTYDQTTGILIFTDNNKEASQGIVGVLYEAPYNSQTDSFTTNPPNTNDWAFNKGSQSATYGQFTTTIGKNSNTMYKIVTVHLAPGTEITPNDAGYYVAVHYKWTEEATGFGAGKPTTPIPEFPSIALPVVAILGIMFIFGRRKQE